MSKADIVMAHRYLYYILNKPVISDTEYDRLEYEAIRRAPADHPIHRPGSSLASSYSTEIVSIALRLRENQS